mmetsp:Transcript_23525/g.3869  ORF Transcript_23525/g.3869 Transcript_23525/m.3869 type:complete len:86 (+) Transcript_23525:222-479(+)
MIYFSYSICGTVAYGDNPPVTPIEQLVVLFTMILMKIYFAYIYAEASTTISNHYSQKVKHLTKVSNVKEWMEHSNISKNLQKKVE